MDKHQQAQWAENLLNDDFFKKVVDDLKSTKISAIISSNEQDVSKREESYRYIKMLDSFVGHLQAIAAEKQIQQKKWKIL